MLLLLEPNVAILLVVEELAEALVVPAHYNAFVAVLIGPGALSRKRLAGPPESRIG